MLPISPKNQYDQRRTEALNSSLEKKITLHNAKKAYEAAITVKKLLSDNIASEERKGLRRDGWSGSATPIRTSGG